MVWRKAWVLIHMSGTRRSGVTHVSTRNSLPALRTMSMRMATRLLINQLTIPFLQFGQALRPPVSVRCHFRVCTVGTLMIFSPHVK